MSGGGEGEWGVDEPGAADVAVGATGGGGGKTRGDGEATATVWHVRRSCCGGGVAGRRQC
jgi:hypothetical protein